MRIPKTCKLPDWFTLEPLEDGSYVAMEDPMVKEMLAVFAERYGNMGCRVFKVIFYPPPPLKTGLFNLKLQPRFPIPKFIVEKFMVKELIVEKIGL